MRIKIITLLLLVATSCFSQKFSVQPGLALGSTVGKNPNPNNKGRVMGHVNGYYNVTKNLSVGVEFNAADKFGNALGTSVGIDVFDPATNTLTKDPSNMGSSAMLAKIKYHFAGREKVIRPFAEFGIGANTYTEKIFKISGSEEITLKRKNLAYQPEIGVYIRHFAVGVQYFIGGKTPSFAGVDEQGVNVRYESIKQSALFVNFSWRFDF